MFDALSDAIKSSVQGAMTIFLIILAFSFMFGPKGPRWVMNTALEPIKAAIRFKLKAIILLCMFVIVSYYFGVKVALALGLGR